MNEILSTAIEVLRILSRTAAARLFGGAAIAMARLWETHLGLIRTTKDIDIIVQSQRNGVLQQISLDLGFRDKRALLSEGRFVGGVFRSIPIDIFLTPLYFNQTIFADATIGEGPMLNRGDLALTKLQIANPKKSDELDAISIILDNARTHWKDAEQTRLRIATACSSDWCLYNAVLNRLKSLPQSAQVALDNVTKAELSGECRRMAYGLVTSKKSHSWRARALAGDLLPTVRHVDEWT